MNKNNLVIKEVYEVLNALGILSEDVSEVLPTILKNEGIVTTQAERDEIVETYYLGILNDE